MEYNKQYISWETNIIILMNYTYKGIFIPSNCPVQQSNETKRVTFGSDNHTHTDSEIRRANIELQKTIDPYVARNYWKLSRLLIGYNNNPWKSVSKLCDEIVRGCIGSTTSKSKTRNETKDTKFISINHKSSFNGDKIGHYIEDTYNIKVVKDFQIERVADTETRFYYVWDSFVNNENKR